MESTSPYSQNKHHENTRRGYHRRASSYQSPPRPPPSRWREPDVSFRGHLYVNEAVGNCPASFHYGGDTAKILLMIINSRRLWFFKRLLSHTMWLVYVWMVSMGSGNKFSIFNDIDIQNVLDYLTLFLKNSLKNTILRQQWGTCWAASGAREPHQHLLLGPHQHLLLGPHQHLLLWPHQHLLLGPHQHLLLPHWFLKVFGRHPRWPCRGNFNALSFYIQTYSISGSLLFNLGPSWILL